MSDQNKKDDTKLIPIAQARVMLKEAIEHCEISPYCCENCAVYDNDARTCANPAAPFGSPPTGFCKMFVHRLFRYPGDPADGPWIVMEQPKGPKKTSG
jgi:hypothetical protein